MKSNYSQRDVVLLNYPFSDNSNYKIRPAVIVSNNKYNNENNDCVVIGITSSKKFRDYVIDILDSDLIEGHLILDSKIKVDHLLLAEKEIIQKKIAKISDTLFCKIKEKLNELFS